jgi:hypothetical protein
MNQNKFSFKKQKLKIDFITLSTQNLNHKKLARYLFDSLASTHLGQGSTERKRFVCESRNQHQVSLDIIFMLRIPTLLECTK